MCAAMPLREFLMDRAYSKFLFFSKYRSHAIEDESFTFFVKVNSRTIILSL
jgi:hypothetical protein